MSSLFVSGEAPATSQPTESTNNPTLPKRRAVLERPAKRKKVEALILQGLSDGEIAKLMNVSRPAITHFRQRHATELQAAVAEVERQIEDYAIAQKVNRIKDAQLRRDLLDQVREARASGGTGIETGIVCKTYKSLGEGQMVEEFKVDTAFLAEWRANDKQVAEELAQLPRPAEAALNVNVGIGFALTWHDGTPA